MQRFTTEMNRSKSGTGSVSEEVGLVLKALHGSEESSGPYTWPAIPTKMATLWAIGQ
jgi:hypothetical protein